MDKYIIMTMNQKSMGKSTIALALGSHFCYNRGLRVLMIDTDNTQHTIYRKFKREPPANGQLKVVSWQMSDFEVFNDHLDTEWQNFDIFIIDTPGSLLDFEDKKDISQMTDLILVPTSPREFDVDSFIKFIGKVKPHIEEGTTLKIVRNFYDSRNVDWKMHDEAFKGVYQGFGYLNSNIPERREYSRYEWTREPNNDQYWTDFYKEIELTLNDKETWQSETQ